MGDSLTYGYDVAPRYGWVALAGANLPIQTVNYGQCGDTTGGMRSRLAAALRQEQPDMVFIMGGTNDILLDYPLSVVEANMEALITQAQAAGITVVAGIAPLTKEESHFFGWQRKEDVQRHNEAIRAYRRWLLDFCGSHGVGTIDFFEAFRQAGEAGETQLYEDGVHPTRKGYALFYQCLAAYLGSRADLVK